MGRLREREEGVKRGGLVNESIFGKVLAAGPVRGFTEQAQSGQRAGVA